MYRNKLKKLREINNLLQKDLAKIVGIHEGRYNQYETEIDVIPLKHLIVLCNYFNVSLDYIFDFTDLKQYKNSINEINKKAVGERLKEIRRENKLTQVKLASILNTVHPVIVNYEKGKYLISTAFLYEICRNYKISADYILGKIDNPKYLS